MKKAHKMLLYFSIFLFLLSTVFLPRILDMESDYATYVNILKIFTFSFNVVLFLFRFHINKFKLLIIISLLIVSFLIFDPTLLNFIALVLFLGTIPDRKIVIKAYFSTKLLLFVIVVIIGLLGVNSDHIIYSIERGTRYTLGFTNPNTASMILFDILLAGSIIIRNKKFLLISLISVIIVYIYTDTRTLILGFLIFVLIFLIPDKKLKIFKPIIVPIFAIGATISYLLILLHNTKLDAILNGRLSIMKNFIINNEITFFGLARKGLLISSDNTYLRILFEFGLIFFAIYLVLHFVLMLKLFKNHEYTLIKIVVSICIYDMFEQFSIAHGTIILIFFSFFIYEKNKRRSLMYENSYIGS